MSNTALTQAGLFGIGQGVGAGMWTLVERYSVTSAAVTSKTFSGLNGNTDRRYKIVSRMVNAIGVITYGVYFNADNGSNYRYQGINSNNSTISGPTNVYTAVPIGSSRGSGIPIFIKGEIDAASGYLRNATFHATAPTSGTAMTYIDNFATVWNNSADNITSMTVLGDQANGLGIGTYIELWKLGPPPPIAMGEWTLQERWTCSVAAPYKDFLGLNGNIDRRYKLVANVKCSAGPSIVCAFPNADTTAANYDQEYLYSGGTTVGGIKPGPVGLRFGYCNSAGTWTTGEWMMWAKTSVPRMARGLSEQTITAGTGMDYHGFASTLWKNTTDNITSLRVAPQTGNLDVGTEIELWKLAQ